MWFDPAPGAVDRSPVEAPLAWPMPRPVRLPGVGVWFALGAWIRPRRRRPRPSACAETRLSSARERDAADPDVRRDRLDQRRGAPPRRSRRGGPALDHRRAPDAGRGRRGRAWETGAGNLAATLLFTCERAPAEAAQISFVAALAVARPGRRLSSRRRWSALKWPNDVLVDGRKAAGILVESGAAPGGRPVAGGRLRRQPGHAPDDAERPATASAEHLRGRPPAIPSPDAALAVLAAAFDALAGGLGGLRLRADRRRLDRARPGPGPALRRAAGQRDRRGRGRRPGRRRRAAAAPGRGRGPPHHRRRRLLREGPDMLLAIEQGNTNTLFAVHDGDDLDRPVARGDRVRAHRRRIRRLAVPAAGHGEAEAAATSTPASSPASCPSRCSTCATWRAAICTSSRWWSARTPTWASRCASRSRPRPAPTGWSTPSARIIAYAGRPAGRRLRHRHHLRRGRRPTAPSRAG